MASKITGFEDLDNKINALGNVGKTVGKKAVREGMKLVVKQMKKDAPKRTGSSSKALKVTTVKTYKTGTAVARGGINASNFEETKHLLYQNYGYENHGLNLNGQKITNHVGWINKSFEKSKNEGEKIIRNYLNKEIEKIIGR